MVEQAIDLIQRLRVRFGDRAVLAGAAGVAIIVVLGVVSLLVNAAGGASDEANAPRTTPTLFDPPTTTSTVVMQISIHVAGAVRSPGLYRTTKGSRVADAIELAGGVSEDVDMERINLAAVLNDGQRVFISRTGQASDPAMAGGPMTDQLRSPDAAGTTTVAPVDLNSAEAAQLETLPGVGPSTAAAILEHRRQIGRFSSVEQLLDVRGIGDAKLDALRDLIVIG